MSNEIQKLNDIIHLAFKNIRVQDMEKANTIADVWSSVLKKINSNNPKANPNEGQNLADHSRVVDLKNGVLLIEADHPGWISLLQMHKKFIIRGINMKVPDLKISTLAFRLKGNRGNLGEIERPSVEKVKEEMSKKLDEENEILRQKNPEFTKKPENLTKNVELPPELAAIFADLKQSMLTNSENK
ncbi:MAG: DUF721 domain-containing protein [Treponema sp.]|nr:DUF721 domain-containing protein [Treponema sp.]